MSLYAAQLRISSLSGVVTGDNVNLISATGSFLDKNVGTGKIVTISKFKIDGSDSVNYTITQPSRLTYLAL